MCIDALGTRLSRLLLVVGISLAGVLSGQQVASNVDSYGDPLPAGAIARLGTTRFRHGGIRLSGLTFLPDNKTLVYLAKGSIFRCDALSGRLVNKLHLDSFHIHGMGVSPDGRSIAVAGVTMPEDDTPIQAEVRLLDIASGKTLRSFPRGDRETYGSSLMFTRDGILFSASEYSGTLWIEEAATDKRSRRERFPGETISSLALSPDGSTLAISTRSGSDKIYLWKWGSGEQPREFASSGYGRLHARLAFSPDGKQLAACGDIPTGGLSPMDTSPPPPLRVWELASGRLVHELTLRDAAEHLRGTPVYSPDGKALFVPSYRKDRGRAVAFHCWDAVNGAYQGRMADAGSPLAISPDGRSVAAGAEVGLRVWRWPSREEILPNNEAHRGSVSCLAIAADATIVTASEDFTIRTWDPITGKQKQKLAHGHGVRSIAVSPDSTRLVSSSLDDTVRLWDMATGREIHRWPGHGVKGWRRAVAFAADGRTIASCGDDCRLRVWDIESGNVLLEHNLQPTGVTPPGKTRGRDYVSTSEARFSRDATLLVLGIGKLHLFDVKTGRELRILHHENSTPTDPLAFSPDGRYLLAGNSGKTQTTLPDGQNRRWPSLSHSVTLWDIDSGEVAKKLALPGGVVTSVAFSANGRRFAVATNLPEFHIAIYDTTSGAEQHAITGLPDFVTHLAFAPDGRTLVSGLGDSTALVWDLP